MAVELTESGCDAFVANTPVSMGYLHGFWEGSHERFLALMISRRGEVELICPALSATQAARSGIERIHPWRDGENPLALFSSVAETWDLSGGVIAVDDHLPAKMLLEMQAALPAALFKPGQALLGSLMRNKTADELVLMRRAADIADRAFEKIMPLLRPGLTERDVASKLGALMSDMGGKPTFAIAATGPGSAEPHHLSDETPLREGDVLIMDFGCDVGNYQSDITRTVAIGEATPEVQEAYRSVFAAHHAARMLAAPGVSGAQVDAAARGVLAEAGLDQFFVHRTGHGIGMQVHEDPYISADNHDPLCEGDCFSVEPGVYLSGKFGIRIENIVTLTESGCESLNAEPSPEIMVANAWHC